MKKLLLFMMCGLLFSACASTPKKGEDVFASSKKPTLSQIQTRAREMVAYFKEGTEKGTLSEEEQKFWQGVQQALVSEKTQHLNKYSDVQLTDEILVAWGLGFDFGYTDKELDKFLGMNMIIQNPYCETEFKSYKVFQVLPDFVLADGCKKTSYDECSISYNKIFMFPKQSEKLYFDNKILKPAKDQCPVYVGVYKYQSNDKNYHVVPIVLFEFIETDKERVAQIQEWRKKSSEEINSGK